MPTPTATPIAIGYRRVSTTEQGESGLGLAAQYAEIEREALERHWDLVAVSTDVASGATMRKRPALAEALAMLKAGEAQILVASKLDRLSRSTLDFATLLERSHREGWQLVVLDVKVDTSTPAGELTATVIAGAAQYERKLIGIRTKSAMREAKLRGIHCGRSPRGAVASDLQILELAKVGKSLREICLDLMDRGEVTSTGGTVWYPSTVKRIIDRAGVLV
jgi:DNA invertase Pin-like site-specific DNA recombinase